MKITGIHLKLLSAAGKVEKEITNFTLAELEIDLKDFCTLQGDKKNEITVSMKVDKGGYIRALQAVPSFPSYAPAATDRLIYRETTREIRKTDQSE